MSRDTALAEAKKLKALMGQYGVRCSIELQVGRPYAGGDDWFTRKHAIMNHHTAGSRSGLTPSLAICKNGRPKLPGPLCNGFGGRDLIYRILTMGLANHPGAGGPLTLAGFTVPKDSARISVWGTEWEHDGVTAWSPSMQEFMGRANAALIDYLDVPLGRSIEHSTWAPGRKIDRNRYTARTGQNEILFWAQAAKPRPKPAPKPNPMEDDMPSVSDIVKGFLDEKIGTWIDKNGDQRRDEITVRTALGGAYTDAYEASRRAGEALSRIDALERRVDELTRGADSAPPPAA